MTACTDTLIDDEGGTGVPDADKGIGQMVLFSVGDVGNTSTSTRAVIPYMEKEGRFVCGMYYHAKAGETDNSNFDTADENARVVTWLKVNNDQGNSVYWNNQYEVLTAEEMETDDYKDYGFDPKAQAFYWKNRLNHVFVGFADYNKLKENTYQTALNDKSETVLVQGSLFAYPENDGIKRTKISTIVSWPNTVGYRVMKFGSDGQYNGADDMTSMPADIGVLSFPIYDESWKNGEIDYSYLRVAFLPELNTAINKSNLTEAEKTALKTDLLRKIYTEPTVADPKHCYGRWYVHFNESDLVPVDPTDPEHPERKKIDLTKASTKILMSQLEKHEEDHYSESPANTFDMTKKDGMTSIANQPDPILAVTKMKPAGATQESNRVHLYFKHQLSQIQVNLTNAESSTGDLTAANIVGVELLGVTEKAYVFTHPSPTGEAIPASYEVVNLKGYELEHLRDNPYGTSFNMFNMGNEKEERAIASFNAIAFGRLEAIRITWNESTDKTGITHAATFKISKDDKGNDLNTLQSGTRYIYDMELRRGTLAVIRADIQGWLLDDELQYSTSGTIEKTP